jgi:hypothetical protein
MREQSELADHDRSGRRSRELLSCYLRLGDLNGPFEDQEQHPARATVFHERLSG